jgi:preprotein translocase subunit SecF
MHGGLKGRTMQTLINTSINQTLSRTVITSLTTLFVCVTLWLLGSEAIKDFAFALTIGIAVGTYSTVFIASPVLVWWHAKKPIMK